MFAEILNIATSADHETNHEQTAVKKNKTQQRNFGGRPPLAIDIVRSQRVVTFLTREENQQLLAMATVQGKSVSSTCHDLLIIGLDSCVNRAE
jgi:hypothetical protein